MYVHSSWIAMAIVTALGCISFVSGSVHTNAQESGSQAASTPATPRQATPADAPMAELTIGMVDIAFEPDEFTIPAHTDVTVRLPNRGVIVHDFNLDPLNIRSGLIQPGDETTVTINAPAGDYEYYCSVPGHRAAGMVGTMHVT
jgi:uncharacterized cupredoxin-like copper-binding protein